MNEQQHDRMNERADMAATKENLIKAGLSNREAEIALLIKTGATNSEMAAMLFITEKTVKYHNTSIFRKLGVKNRHQAIVKIFAM